MACNEVCDTHVTSVDLPRDRNLRFVPHPILADPRAQPGYGNEHSAENSHSFDARIPQTHFDMLLANDGVGTDNVKMKCCCGRSDCAYLEHNNTALGGLEKDLETAARLGQALLSRHESYINESQAERNRLSTCVSELEAERLSLQSANEKMVAENRGLLAKLEHLNDNLADSDEEVKRLEALLLDCELEVKRLNGLVRKTEELDNKLHAMEQQCQSINKEMEEGQAETRSTIARWQESERKVRELEEEVRRIEWEARLDREKHEEIVARLEKERSFERELGGAEGRLKGAAALQSLKKNTEGSKHVVTHFVKDILQDNANLQAGIEELRQLLQSSNEEVQNLREQIMLHQPVGSDESFDSNRKSISLEQDLQPEAISSSQVQREVHVHHHYHTKSTKPRVNSVRKASRRRTTTSGHGNTSDSSVPSTPISRPQRYNSSPVVPLSLQQSQSQNNRWSMQSTATTSSVLSSAPGSPRSYLERGWSNFDRIEQGEESSRPTSPESTSDLQSPGPGQWGFRQNKRSLDACKEEEDQNPAFQMSPLVDSKPIFDVNELPTPSDSEPSEIDKELTPKPSLMLVAPTVEAEESIARIPEPLPPDKATDTAPVKQPLARKSSQAILNDVPKIRPGLARKASHETLVSISGMDIHLAQRSSSASTLELLHSHFAHRPSQTRKATSVQPVAEVTEYTVTSTPTSVIHNEFRTSSRQIPSSIEALSGIAVPKTRAARMSTQTGAMGRLGGWVRGRWGIAPTKSSGDLRTLSRLQEPRPTIPTTSMQVPQRNPVETTTTTTNNDQTPKSANPDSLFALPSSAAPAEPVPSSIGTPAISVPSDQSPIDQLHKDVDPMILFAGRSPGVNQPGFIPGFRSAIMNRRTPSQVMTSVIDEEGLRDSLAEP